MDDDDNICFWFPDECRDDPTNPDPTPKPKPDDNGSYIVVENSDPFLSPIAGQLAFFTIALLNIAVPVMKNFRWRKTITG